MADKDCPKCNGTGYVMFNKCDLCRFPVKTAGGGVRYVSKERADLINSIPPIEELLPEKEQKDDRSTYPAERNPEHPKRGLL